MSLPVPALIHNIIPRKEKPQLSHETFNNRVEKALGKYSEGNHPALAVRLSLCISQTCLILWFTLHPAQVTFEAVRGLTEYGDTAVDNVGVRNGPCGKSILVSQCIPIPFFHLSCLLCHSPVKNKDSQRSKPHKKEVKKFTVKLT